MNEINNESMRKDPKQFMTPNPTSSKAKQSTPKIDYGLGGKQHNAPYFHERNTKRGDVGGPNKRFTIA